MDWSHVLIALTTAVVALLVAVVGGTRELILAWLERLTSNVRNAMASRIGHMAAYMEAIDAVKKVKNVDRVLVFSGKNGGGRPTPGKAFTVQAVHGWAKDPLRDPMKRYDFPINIDAFYARMLESLIRDGVVEVIPAEMPDDARLKIYYLAEGVTCSRLYFINIIGNEILYMSAASFTDKFTNADRIELDLAVDRVRAAMVCF